jgi:hypothetical protein
MVKIVVNAWFDPNEADYVGGNCFQEFNTVEKAIKFLENQIKDRIDFAREKIMEKKYGFEQQRLV